MITELIRSVSELSAVQLGLMALALASWVFGVLCWWGIRGRSTLQSWLTVAGLAVLGGVGILALMLFLRPSNFELGLGILAGLSLVLGIVHLAGRPAPVARRAAVPVTEIGTPVSPRRTHPASRALALATLFLAVGALGAYVAIEAISYFGRLRSDNELLRTQLANPQQGLVSARSDGETGGDQSGQWTNELASAKQSIAALEDQMAALTRALSDKTAELTRRLEATQAARAELEARLVEQGQELDQKVSGVETLLAAERDLRAAADRRLGEQDRQISALREQLAESRAEPQRETVGRVTTEVDDGGWRTIPDVVVPPLSSGSSVTLPPSVIYDVPDTTTIYRPYLPPLNPSP